MTKRIVYSLLGGWLAGGIVFFIFIHQPLESLAPALAFGTALFLMMVFK